MDIPPEVIAAREAIEDVLLSTGLVTGIDFGVRDEANPDADDLALRIFVRDTNNVPVEAQVELPGGFPVVVLERVFRATLQLPDTSRHQPVVGGVSVTAARFVTAGSVPVGTLGAIVHHTLRPSILGLSNYHVLCHDGGRQQGQEIIHPEPTPFGRVSNDHLGTLEDWSFPETTPTGTVDAAICAIDVTAAAEIADIGPCTDSNVALPMMMVTKRGRTTGQTFGWISGINGTYGHDYPHLPPVGTPPSTMRFLKGQFQIHADFPQSLVFGESGDSGSVVLDSNSRAVGLYWGSGSKSLGDPEVFGLATPIELVESALHISFQWPQPVIDEVDPATAVAGDTLTLRGSGFVLASVVKFGDTDATFEVTADDAMTAECPNVSGDVALTVVAPGGTSEAVSVSVTS